MKRILFLSVLLFPIACTKGGVMSPFQTIGCDVETAVTSAAATAIASSVSCTNQAQIQQDIQVALGNVNLCSTGLSVASLSGPKWTKVGDVSKQDIDKAKASKGLAPMGIVGNIACPIVVNTLIGFATQSIPSGWACSANTTAQSLSQSIVTACELAVPL